jgi:hypothetical protein
LDLGRRVFRWQAGSYYGRYDADIAFKMAYVNAKPESGHHRSAPLPGRAIRNKFLDDVSMASKTFQVPEA